MIARTEPGQRQREQAGMRRGDLEADAEVAVERGKLIGHDGLGRPLPRANRLGIDAGDGARRVEKEIPA